MEDQAATRPATVSDFMFLADCMTTRRMEYEKQPSQPVWMAYRKARDELQSALVSGVVDFCAACGGVGERPVTVGHPPDDYWDEIHPCPDCNGSGNVHAAPSLPTPTIRSPEALSNSTDGGEQ